MPTSGGGVDAASVVRLSRIGGHVANLVARDGVNRVARFVAAVLLARALTLHDYGVFNTGIALAGIAVTGASLGLNDLGARDIGARQDDPAWRSGLAGQVLAARLGLVVALSAIAIAVIVVAAPASLGTALLIVAIVLTMSANADWILRGLERMAALGNAILIGGVAVLLGSVLLLLTTGSANGALAVILAGEAVSTAAAWAWSDSAPRIGVDREALGRLLSRSWPLGVSSLAMYTYYANLDTVLLAALRSAREAGLYSAPYRVFLALNAVSIYTAYAFLPALSRAVEAGNEGPAFAQLRRAVRYLLAYTVVLVALAELVGGELMGLLFGDAFSGTGDVFVVLSLALMWFSIGFPIGYSLIARHQNRRFLAGAATGGLLNLALNLVLIPAYGAIGAAAATGLAFAAACLVWLRASLLLGREAAADIIAMATVSAIAIPALAVDGLRIPGFVVTLAIAAFCARSALRHTAAASGASE